MRRFPLFVASACAAVILSQPALAQLQWFRSDKAGGVPLGGGTSVRFELEPRERGTFYTTGFSPVTLHAPGVTATLTLTFTLDGMVSEIASTNDTRFMSVGLFDHHGTSTGISFEDDSGYYFIVRNTKVDSNFAEVVKRLGNGKSATLGASGEARARMNLRRTAQGTASLTTKVPYKVVMSLTRTKEGGIMVKSDRDPAMGLSIVGGGTNFSAYSSEPDTAPESYTLNQLGITFDNRTSGPLVLEVKDLQLVLTRDGKMLSVSTKPEITDQPQSVVGMVGAPVKLSVGVIGEGLAFQWMKNGKAIAGAVSSSLLIEEASLDDIGRYSVVASSPYGQTESQPATVRMQQMVSLKPEATPVAEVVYLPEQVDVQPEQKGKLKVRYPKSDALAGVQGTSTLRFIVTSQGYVDGLQVAKFAHPDLVEPLMVAYQKARFTPAMKDGKPVSVLHSVTVAYPPAK